MLPNAVARARGQTKYGAVVGTHRTLHVDGVAVAEDAQDGLESPASGFYIGAGNAMAPGTYFSGMIDDVRIYSRVMTPQTIELFAR